MLDYFRINIGRLSGGRSKSSLGEEVWGAQDPRVV